MDGLICDVCMQSSHVFFRLADGCRRVCRGAIGGGSAPLLSGTSCAGFGDPPMQTAQRRSRRCRCIHAPRQVPHVCRPTTEPNANSIAEAEVPTERWQRPHRGSPATLWSVSERVASGGRPTTQRRMTRRGVAGQRKHSFGICLPPAPRSHLVQRSW